MLAAVLGWVLPCQSTPSLLHKWPKGRFGLHAIVDIVRIRGCHFVRGQQESWGEEAGGCLRLIEAKEDLAALHNVLAKTRICENF